MHVDEKGRAYSGQQCFLIDDALNAHLGHDSTYIRDVLHGFEHFFHRVLIPRFDVLYFPHFPEASLPDYIVVAKHLLLQLHRNLSVFVQSVGQTNFSNLFLLCYLFPLVFYCRNSVHAIISSFFVALEIIVAENLLHSTLYLLLTPLQAS